MRNALNALTAELRRLKTAGVKSIPVSDASLAALRGVVTARGVESNSPAVEASVNETMAGTTKRQEPPVSFRLPTATAVPASTLPTLAAPVVVLPHGDKTVRWAALQELVLNDPNCRANIRPGKKVVLGAGSLEAKIMFVGEAPGAEEEVQGEPFVGPAGQLLTKMIQAMGLKRTDVYIGNIMNWRPQMPVAAGVAQVGNRPPTEDEIRYCLPYLRAQIDVVNPEILVALGKTAAQGLLGYGSFDALGQVRGKWHEFAGKPLMVTYHPSYILRNQSNRAKRMIWEDLLQVMERINLPISEKQQGYFLDK